MIVELACCFPDPANPWRKTYILDGQTLTPARSLRLAQHSPDGFNHGYGGSGPAQLALAICLELFGRRAALSFYQQFKWEHIATLGHHGEREAQHEDFTVLLNVSRYADLAAAQDRAGNAP